MLKFIAKILVFVGLLSAISSAMNLALAGRVENLYDLEVLVADESPATREQAFNRGLDEIFVRISGDSIVMDKLKRPPASRYVKQFSYEPVDQPTPNKDDELLTHRLKIQYNGSAMEKYLLENGFSAWGEYRPDVVVWLVVRDGRNEYVLREADRSVLKTATVDALIRRGIPNRWPVYDKTDKKILGVSDIRGGFKEPVEKASLRYSRGPALTGSMIWNGKQWQSSWSLLMEGENRHWNLDGVDHERLINKSIDQAADALGVGFAVHTTGDKQKMVTVLLDVQQVKNIASYVQVENYLTGLSAVDKVKPFNVDGQNAVFEVLLRSNEEDFLNLIKNDAELTEVEHLNVDTPESKTQEIKVPELAPSEPPEPELVPSEDNMKNVSATEPSGIADKDIAAKVDAAQAVTSDAQLSAGQRKIYYYRLN